MHNSVVPSFLLLHHCNLYYSLCHMSNKFQLRPRCIQNETISSSYFFENSKYFLRSSGWGFPMILNLLESVSPLREQFSIWQSLIGHKLNPTVVYTDKVYKCFPPIHSTLYIRFNGESIRFCIIVNLSFEIGYDIVLCGVLDFHEMLYNKHKCHYHLGYLST